MPAKPSCRRRARIDHPAYSAALVDAVLNGRDAYPALMPPLPPVRSNGVWLSWESVYGPPPALMIPISQKLRERVVKASADGSLRVFASAVVSTGGLADGPVPSDGPGSSDPQAMGFYRVVRRGVHPAGLTNGLTLAGVGSFPVEIWADEAGTPQLRLMVNGDIAPASVTTTATGCPVLEWDTQYLPNGTYTVWAECDFPGGQTVLYSETNKVTIANDLTFDSMLSSFGEQMWIFAQVASPPVSYEIAMFDGETDQYLGSFNDTNTDGNISFLWDLTDGAGYTFTNQSFRGEFHISSLAARGPSKTATNRWTKDNGWTQDDFAIAWANTAKVLAPSRMRDLMRYGVVDILGTPDGGYNLSPGNVFGTGQSFNLTAATQTNLLAYLNDPSYRNFYFYGHGNASGIGDSSQWAVNPPWITELELRAAMTNHLGETTKPGTTVHPYRFVFLDSCNSANGNLCEAFGIHRVPANYWSTSFYVNILKMKPRVFVGYTTAVNLPSTYDEHMKNAHMLGQFLGSWRDGASINGIIVAAKANTQWPLSGSTITYGAWNLWRTAP